MRIRTKLCCIQDARELQHAVAAGADALGFVGQGLSGPEVIDDDAAIASLVAQVPPPVDPWLLTRETDPIALVTQVTTTGVKTVQLCDRVTASTAAALRAAVPGVRLVQVIHVAGPETLEDARDAAQHADALLLDSGAPAEGAWGGTGRTHDWSVSAAVVEATDRPVILAGGLRPDNVGEAIATVRPWMVDLCSGIRRDGVLDPALAGAFVAAVGRAQV